MAIEVVPSRNGRTTGDVSRESREGMDPRITQPPDNLNRTELYEGMKNLNNQNKSDSQTSPEANKEPQSKSNSQIEFTDIYQQTDRAF